MTLGKDMEIQFYYNVSSKLSFSAELSDQVTTKPSTSLKSKTN